MNKPLSFTKRLYEFDNGISLSVEDDGTDVEDKIKLTATDDSKVKAEFIAKLKKVGS